MTTATPVLMPMPVSPELQASDYDDLAALDTFHDYWKERKTANTSTDEEEEDEEAPDENKMEYIRNSVLRLNQQWMIYNGVPGISTTDDVSAIIRRLTEGKVTSATANFEPRVQQYFEEKYADILNSNMRETITYDDILTRRAELEAKYSGEGTTGGRIYSLEIVVGKNGKRVKNYSVEERRQIADFITTFMFGDVAMPPKLTFDAKAGVVRHIYRPVADVMCVITPQTVADSAASSLSQLEGRNEFVFPMGQEMPITSNVYTRNKYELAYVDNGFCAQNMSGFSLKFTAKPGIFTPPTPTPTVLMPFSTPTAQYTEGPSVNYLGSLIMSVSKSPRQEFRDVQPSKRGMFPIGAMIQDRVAPAVYEHMRQELALSVNREGLFYDLKRAGDHEQVNAVVELLKKYPRMMFVTIDRLAAVCARLRLVPTMFHVGDTINVFRLLTGQAPIDPAEVQRMRFQRIKQMSDEISEILTRRTLGTAGGFATVINPSIRDELGAERVKLTTARMGVFEPPKMKPSDRTDATKRQVRDIITGLIRLRMLNMIQQIDAILADMDRINSSLSTAGEVALQRAVAEAINAVNTRRVVPAASIADAEYTTIYAPIMEMYSKLEGSLNALNLKAIERRLVTRVAAGEGTDRSIRLVLKLGTNDYIRAGTGIFTPVKTPILNYNYSDYLDLYEQLLSISRIYTQRYGAGRGRSSILNDFAKLGLTATIQTIQDSFFDTPGTAISRRDVVFRILNPNSVSIPDASLNDFGYTNRTYGEFISPASIFSRLDPILTGAGLAPAPALAPVVVGGEVTEPVEPTFQTGGAGDPQQYRDLSDLFRNICFMCGRFVDGLYSQMYPDLLFISNVENVEKLLKMYSKTHKEQTHYGEDAHVAIINRLINTAVALSIIVNNDEVKGVMIKLNTSTMRGGVITTTKEMLSRRADVKGTAASNKQNALESASERLKQQRKEERIRMARDREYREQLLTLIDIYKRYHGLSPALSIHDIKTTLKNSNSNLFFDITTRVTSTPSLLEQANALHEEILSEWELGLASIQVSTDYDYELKDTEQLITAGLTQTAPEGISVGLRTRINDIAGIYLTGRTVPPQLITILLFALLDSTLTSSSTGYLDDYVLDTDMTFDNQRQWDILSNFIYPYVSNIRSKLEDPSDRRPVPSVLRGLIGGEAALDPQSDSVVLHTKRPGRRGIHKSVRRHKRSRYNRRTSKERRARTIKRRMIHNKRTLRRYRIQ